jgi:hypothetical protein
MALMEHDLFSGEVTGVRYMDVPRTEEVVSALNDDQEIDDILQEVSDPLGYLEPANEPFADSISAFLKDFRTQVMDQANEEALLKLKKK